MTNLIYTHNDFIQNKYLDWYVQLIESRKLLDRKKNNGVYYERHHILPKSQTCFPELVGCKDNLILLTAREHYIAHILLMKFTSGLAHRSMIYAVHKMLNGNDELKHIKISSRLYQSIKREFAKKQSERMTKLYSDPTKHPMYGVCGEDNPLYGSKRRDDQILRGKKHPMYGKKHTESTKAKMSISRKGKSKNSIWRAKISESNRKSKSSYYYYVFDKCYESSKHASEFVKLSYATILLYCRNPTMLITKAMISKSYYFNKDDIGKTVGEFGFYMKLK